MSRNETTMHLQKGAIAQTDILYQYDYGQKLLFTGVDLPETFEVHFSNQSRGESKTAIGSNSEVLIPDEYFLSGANIYVWIYLHDGEDDGETEYHGVINIARRAKPTDQEPTPVQQDVITQAIAALNVGVERAETAQEMAETAQGLAEAAQTAAETAQGFAETAQSAAEEAQSKAEAAQGLAETAQGKAETAQAAAETAQSKAETAQASAETAAANAARSATAAETAKGEAEDAQADAEQAARDARQTVQDVVDDIVDLKSALNEKQDAPSVAGTEGQVLGLDSNLDPVWVNQSGGTVKDVQVNGISILDAQGVANVPIPDTSAYATKTDTVLETTLSLGRKEDTTIGTNSIALGEDVEASNNRSFAEGYRTVASGADSHAEGSGTTASGSYSHAEGGGTTASGQSSHSEGISTTASGSNSHAEGGTTTASGNYSHAEGVGTKANGNQSHAEGAATIAKSTSSHAEGSLTVAAGEQSHAEGYGDTQATKTIGSTTYTGTGAHGTNSHSEGYKTWAIGSNSHAEGTSTVAPGENSHAEGGGTYASGSQSHAEGGGTTASGMSSHSEGSGTTAIGSNSHAEGGGTRANGDQSHAEGGSTTASGNNAHAEGYMTKASGIQSHAEGSGDTQATKTIGSKTYTGTGAHGERSHSEGYMTWAIGQSSHAEGAATTASGSNSHAEGGGTTANGNQSHSEGSGTTASGSNSHAEGGGTTASGANSHAEGSSTVASGFGSHAEGVTTIARGSYSHVGGVFNVEDSYANWPEWTANTSYEVGDKVKVTTGSGSSQTIQGYICKTSNSDSTFTSSKWTSQDGKMNYAEIIGNGTTGRSNARALDWDGNGYYAGDVYVHANADSTGGTKLATVEDISDLNLAITELDESKYEKPSTGIPASDLASGVIPAVPVQDVQVNGTSILQNGVANVPVATESKLGVVRADPNFGTGIYSNRMIVARAPDDFIINGANTYRPIVPVSQHISAFYGLAKAAGSDEKNSTLPVGQYTESAKSAISEMLNGSVSVSGTTPTINALPGVRYVCGEVATLDVTVPASGIVDVVFTSGATPAVLTVTPPTGMTMKWANGFDPTSLDADTTYEINVMDGCLGVAAAWS